MLIPNTDLVKNGIITPKDWEYRTEKDEKHRKSVENQFKEIVKFIKEESYDKGEDIFVKLKMGWVKRNFEFAETNDIATLGFALKNDPNIICKEEDGIEDTSKNRPQLYRWVSKKEKTELGFDAVVYKNVSSDILNILKTDFVDYESKPSEILAVIDRLIVEGADRGWITFSPLRISGRAGIPIDIIQNVLNDLMNNDYIQIDKISEEEGYKGRKPSNVTLTFTDEIRTERLAQLNNDKVELFIPEKKERAKRKQVDELDSVISARIRENRNKSMMSHTEETPSGEWNLPELSFSQKNDRMAYEKQFDMLSDRCLSGLEEMKRLISRMGIDARKENENTGKNISELTQKVLDQDKLISQQESKIAKLQGELEQEKIINNDFSMSVIDKITDFQANIMSAVEEFSKKPVYQINNPTVMNRFKMQIFNLASDLSKELLNWNSDEKKVPNLLK